MPRTVCWPGRAAPRPPAGAGQEQALGGVAEVLVGLLLERVHGAPFAELGDERTVGGVALAVHGFRPLTYPVRGRSTHDKRQRRRRFRTTPAWSDGQRPFAARSETRLPTTFPFVPGRAGLEKIRSMRWSKPLLSVSDRSEVLRQHEKPALFFSMRGHRSLSPKPLRTLTASGVRLRPVRVGVHVADDDHRLALRHAVGRPSQRAQPACALRGAAAADSRWVFTKRNFRPAEPPRRRRSTRACW